MADAENTALVTALDLSARAISGNDTAIASDHWKTLQVTGATTITLSSAASMGAGYEVGVFNAGASTVTVTPGLASDTINNVSASVTVPIKGTMIFRTNQALTGYNIVGQSNSLQQLNQGIDISGSTAGQITFPATQNASAGVNVLDDYEEGTWTPSLGGTTTYAIQSGVYTKIGRLVFIQCTLSITLIGTGSTTVISGLPFANSGSTIAALSVVGANSLATAVTSLLAGINASASTITVDSRTAAQTSDGTSAIFANGTSINIAGVYQAT